MKGFVAMAVLMAGSAALAGCDSGEAPKAVSPQTVHARVVESWQEEIPEMVRTTGTLHARETATLSAQVMGRVERVPLIPILGFENNLQGYLAHVVELKARTMQSRQYAYAGLLEVLVEPGTGDFHFLQRHYRFMIEAVIL